MINYLVSEFAKDTLSNLVKESFGADFPDVFAKKQITYLYNYLSDLKAQSILLELDYIDRDYLEDFTKYYVRRFSGGGPRCARLHFFSTEVQHTLIEEALGNPNGTDARDCLEENYLGFIVIKPLPQTFIGRTCLKTYSDMERDDGSKKVLHRKYTVDLFGIALHVESIAFQEQDKMVSACATTAIWSALHSLYWRPTREIPACSEITLNAINHIDGSINSFPSKELSNKQILRALDVEKLKNHYLALDNIPSERFLKQVKYHIDSKLPLILGVDVYSRNKEGEFESLAGHAVCVVGYKQSDTPAIYIHDDRLGPFARATLVELNSVPGFKEIPNSNERSWGLSLQEKNDNGEWKDGHEILVPKSLIMPTPKKVRLPSTYADTTARVIVKEHTNWLSKLDSKSPLLGKVTFAIKLLEISRIRKEVVDYDFTTNGADTNDHRGLRLLKINFLTRSYARFHWVVDFKVEGFPAFRVLFDATDIPQGNAVAGIFVQDAGRAAVILEIFRIYAEKYHKIEMPYENSFYMAFLRHLRSKEASFDDELDKKYGAVRAPKYLKVDEVVDGDVARSESRKVYYFTNEKTLDDEFPGIKVNDVTSYLIWAISFDGALLIGKEIDGQGHPSLTHFKPARIAGELHRTSSGWKINSKSGRYSGDYPNPEILLDNAVEKFNTVFYKSRGKVAADYFKPQGEEVSSASAGVS